MSWVDIGVIDDILVWGVCVLKLLVGCIVIFRIVEVEVFVVVDKCLYKGGFLFEGIVYENKVICLLYNWVFDLNIGEVQGVDEGCIDIYVVCIENGCILFDIEFIMVWNVV